MMISLFPLSLGASMFLRSFATASSDPDPYCLTGIKTENYYTYSLGVRAVCCPASCGQCGGSGCQGADCCVGGVINKPSCDESGPPCVIHDTDCLVAGIRADSAWLQSQYNVRFTCCPKSCGQCGGSGCNEIANHTAAECCVGPISIYGESCKDTGLAPCYMNFTKDLIEQDLGVELSLIYEDYFPSGFPPFNDSYYVPYADKAFVDFTSFNETEANKRYKRDDSHLELMLLPGDLNPFLPNATSLNSRTELLLRTSVYGGTPFQESIFSITTFFNDVNFDATFFQIMQPASGVRPLFSLEVNKGSFGTFIQVRFRGPNSGNATAAPPSHYPERIDGIFRNFEHNLFREVRWDVHLLPSLDPSNGFIKLYREGTLVWSSLNQVVAPCVYTAGWNNDTQTYSETCQGTRDDAFNTQMGVYSFAGEDTPFPGPDPMTIKIAHFGIFKVE